MANGYILTPFALEGDRVPVSVDVAASGAVTWEEGYGSLYQEDPDVNGLYVPRDAQNEIFYTISFGLKEIQDLGVPTPITLEQAGGVAPHPYAQSALVHVDGQVLRSLVPDNVDDPTGAFDPTAWRIEFAQVNWEETDANSSAYIRNRPDLVDATVNVKGLVRLATIPEALAGVPEDVAVTPTGLDASRAVARTFRRPAGLNINVTAAGDAGGVISSIAPGATTFTVVDGGWQPGMIVNILQEGLGTLSFVAGTGITMQRAQGLTNRTRTRYSNVSLTFITATTCVLNGDLEQG